MRWLALCAALAGCGRLSFDARSLDAVVEDVVIDASPAVTSREADVATFSTTSTSFVDVPGAQLMVPPSPGQTWWLLVNGYLTSTSELYDGPEAQYLVDGVVRGMGGTESIGGNPGPWQHFYVFDGTTQWTTIQVQVRDALGATATLSKLRIIAIPLPSATSPRYAASDAAVVLPVGTNTVATLDLGTLATSQTYTFFLLDNATEAPGSTDIDVTWYSPSNTVWRGADRNPRGAWQSSLYVRTQTVGPGPVTVRLEAEATAMTSVAYVRVLALDVSGFVTGTGAFSNTSQTTSSGPVEVSSIIDVIGAAPQYLVFGTMKVDEDCAANVATRGAHYILDGVETAVAHKSGNCALDTTYGFLDLVTARPSSFSAQISSGTGENVEHQESQLFWFGVD